MRLKHIWLNICYIALSGIMLMACNQAPQCANTDAAAISSTIPIDTVATNTLNVVIPTDAVEAERVVIAFGNAWRANDTEAFYRASEILFAHRKKGTPDRIRRESRHTLQQERLVDLSITERGVIENVRYLRFTYTSVSTWRDATNMNSLYVIYDDAGSIISCTPFLDGYRFQRSVAALLAQCDNAEMYFSKIDNKIAWHRQRALSQDEIILLASGLLRYDDCSVGQSSCPFTIRIDLHCAGKMHSLYFSTDDCDIYYMDTPDYNACYARNTLIDTIKADYERFASRH